MNGLHLISFLIIISLLCSCKQNSKSSNVLVEIGNKKLTLDQALIGIPNHSSSQDSSNIINHKVDQWIKETLFNNEASKNISANEVEDLVEAYKESLIAHYYEQKLLTEQLDSTITQEELNQIFKNNREDLFLSTPAYLIFYSQVLPDDYKTIADDWSDSKWEEIEEYAKEKNINYFISDSLYINEETNPGFPDEVFDNIKWTRGYFGAKKVDGIWNFIQVMKRSKPGSLAPQNLIENKLRDLILHKRKKELINQKKIELYEKAISKNSVVNFSDKF